MLSIQASLIKASSTLAAFEASSLEADILLAYILQKPRAYLFAHPEEMVDAVSQKHFQDLIERRLQGEPMAYLIGKKECWSREWRVTKDTLIPRPETECLIEYLLMHFPPSPLRVADLGTGSGVIGLTLALERPLWEVVLTDRCERALQVAKENAGVWGVSNVSFSQGDWCFALPSQPFNLIVSNPPYIAETEWNVYADGLQFEPYAALVSGRDGLTAIRQIANESRRYLASGGSLAIEHGFMQGQAVREILAEKGYRDVITHNDLSHRERFTVGRFFSL